MNLEYNHKKTVIVYLAMNTSKDETYGRDSRSMLEQSLDSLYLYYNNEFKHDIIIFYDNKFPFLMSDQEEIKKGRSEIKFHLLEGDLWSPPKCQTLVHSDPTTWICPKFSVGYRNMMRWYGILIYKYLKSIGYDWYMRMDDDSLLHSKINYDLFKFMVDNHYEYGFRAYCNDSIYVSNGLIEYCNDYCKLHHITPTFLHRHTLYHTCTESRGYNVLGYYNNFLISKIDFWMREDVQHFLNDFDNTGYQYTKRWNDLISQAVTIQIFMERHKIKHFNDFCYEHTTFLGEYDAKKTIDWGGLFPKIVKDSVCETQLVRDWNQTYGVYHCNVFDTLDIQHCLIQLNMDFLFSTCPDHDEFNSFSNNALYYLGKYDTLDNVYFAIEDHLMNCQSNVSRCIQYQYPKPFGFTWYHSTKHKQFNQKLYVINNPCILHMNEDSDTTSFILSKDFMIQKNTKIITI